MTLYCIRTLNCNKRISHAGPERSAGRPGHTPTRRILECDENIEDSCAGQDWSAGRPSHRLFGARTSRMSAYPGSMHFRPLWQRIAAVA